MTSPFRPSASSSATPRGCGGDRCASGRDAWPLHHVRHDGVFCRLCSSCVLLYHPAAYCSVCVRLLPVSRDGAGDPVLAPPSPTAACSDCGLSVVHLSCLPAPGDPASASSFVCPPCAAANEGRPFSFTPPAPVVDGGRRALDERAARVLLIAARLANDSVGRAAAAAREEAERRCAEAAAARKRCREMLDTAFRALEAEARATAASQKPPPAAPAPAQPPPKKKTPKSNEANNRDRDKLLKLNAMQQPALAFAAAAAAAASSMPPSSKEEKKPVKQEAQGSAPREDRAPLFGALQP